MTSETVTAPVPAPAKKLSTGAIVAGAVGVAAIVGIVALAAHKPTRARARHHARRAHKAVKRAVHKHKRK